MTIGNVSWFSDLVDDLCLEYINKCLEKNQLPNVIDFAIFLLINEKEV